MKRRNALVGLGMLATGGGVISGTGAFSSVTAERGMEVTTSSDANANLGLEPLDTPNGKEYADSSGDTLSITAHDINLDAITKIDRVFRITNNGGQAVVIYLEEILDDDDTYATSTDFGVLAEELTNPEEQENLQYPILGDDRISISSSTPPDSAARYDEIGVLLGEGVSLEVGFYIDTSDNNIGSGLDETSGFEEINADDLLLEGVTIHASATKAESGNYRFKTKDD